MRWRDSDIEITFYKGSGPGGQNRNKRETGVRIVHLPTGITVTATERRSQPQNLEAAKERLTERLERHYHRPKARRATKATRGSVERRIQSKKSRSSVKNTRRSRDFD